MRGLVQPARTGNFCARYAIFRRKHPAASAGRLHGIRSERPTSCGVITKRYGWSKAMAIELESWLSEYIRTHGGVAGTVHLREGEQLVLKASVNIPPPVVAATRTIPKGKGMAGLAWERQRPVSTCNLKADDTGDVRPGAKAVQAQAAVAIPVHADGEVQAVVGIAFSDDRDIGETELSDLQSAAGTLELSPSA